MAGCRRLQQQARHQPSSINRRHSMLLRRQRQPWGQQQLCCRPYHSHQHLLQSRQYPHHHPRRHQLLARPANQAAKQQHPRRHPRPLLVPAKQQPSQRAAGQRPHHRPHLRLPDGQQHLLQAAGQAQRWQHSCQCPRHQRQGRYLQQAAAHCLPSNQRSCKRQSAGCARQLAAAVWAAAVWTTAAALSRLHRPQQLQAMCGHR